MDAYLLTHEAEWGGFERREQMCRVTGFALDNVFVGIVASTPHELREVALIPLP